MEKPKKKKKKVRFIEKITEIYYLPVDHKKYTLNEYFLNECRKSIHKSIMYKSGIVKITLTSSS